MKVKNDFNIKKYFSKISFKYFYLFNIKRISTKSTYSTEYKYKRINYISSSKFSLNIGKIMQGISKVKRFEDFMNLFEPAFSTILQEPIKTQVEFWYHAVFTANSLLCDKILKKEDILKFLTFLNYFQPKVVKQTLIPENIRNPITSSTFTNPKHQQEYFNRKKPNDLVGLTLLLVKNNFFKKTGQIFKEFFFNNSLSLENNKTRHDIDDLDLEKISYSMNDLLEQYSIFFDNIEKKFIDDVYYGRVDYSFEECTFFIQSFGIAKEGSNLFFEVLMRKISKNIEAYINSQLPQKEKIITLQVVLNYLPHELYNISKQSVLDKSMEGYFVEEGLTEQILQFYEKVFNFLKEIVDDLSNEDYLSTLQGLLKIPFTYDDLVKIYLESFNERVSKTYDKLNTQNKEEIDIKENEIRITKKDFTAFIFKYIEIATYFIRQENKAESFNVVIINQAQILEKLFYDAYANSLNIKEIATIFWFSYNINLVNENLINKFAERITEQINLALINLHNENSKKDNKLNKLDVNSSSNLKDKDSFAIDNYDLEAIIYFTSKYSYHPTIKFIKKALITLKSNFN